MPRRCASLRVEFVRRTRQREQLWTHNWRGGVWCSLRTVGLRSIGMALEQILLELQRVRSTWICRTSEMSQLFTLSVESTCGICEIAPGGLDACFSSREPVRALDCCWNYAATNAFLVCWFRGSVPLACALLRTLWCECTLVLINHCTSQPVG